MDYAKSYFQLEEKIDFLYQIIGRKATELEELKALLETNWDSLPDDIKNNLKKLEQEKEERKNESSTYKFLWKISKNYRLQA